MKKISIWLLTSALAALVVLLGNMFYTIHHLSLVNKMECAAASGEFRLPATLCRYWLYELTPEPEQLKALEVDGIAYLLNMNVPERFDFADWYLAHGLNIDAPVRAGFGEDSDLSPLHAMVLTTDVEAVRYLLSKGASAETRSKVMGSVTAGELAEKIREKKPTLANETIVKLLRRSAATRN